jgi:hypothetical protein
MHCVQNPKYNFFFLMYIWKKKINSWPRAFITRGQSDTCNNTRGQLYMCNNYTRPTVNFSHKP